MSSIPLRARSPFFAFDAETGARRPRWFVALAALLAVLVALAGVLIGVTAASAHDKNWDVSCFGLKVVLTNYNTAGDNTVSIKVDGVEQVPAGTRGDFGANYTFATTWDPSVDHVYEIHVDAWDGATWDLHVGPTTQKACAKPTVGLTVTECHTTGGTTDVTATFAGFASYSSSKAGFPSFAPSYTAQLLRDGVVVQTLPNVQGIAGGTFTWPGQAAGHLYQLVVKADGAGNAGLSSTAEARAIACPELKDFSVAVQQCTSPTGDNSALHVSATVTPGRAYTVVLTHNGAVIQTQSIPASNTSSSASLTFSVAQNLTGLQVVMTDTAAAVDDPNRERLSNLLDTKPCPQIPTLAVVPSVCTTVGGALTVTVDISGLVLGRDYQVAIDGAVVETLTAVTSSTIAGKVYPVTAGSHVVTVTDVAVPTATKSSDPVTVAECPTQPHVAITPDQCDVPGGAAAITVTFSGLATGRSYEVTITEDGSAMPAYAPVTIDAATTSKDYTGLQPGSTYVVTITDKAATGVKDAATQVLALCPATPQISVVPRCEIISGTTYYGVSLAELQVGHDYVVTIKDSKGVDVATPVTVTGGQAAPAPTFQVPNGAFYKLAVTSVANAAITASIDVFAALCDFPTLPLPPELPTLALTGSSNATMPMLGALGLVQFGVALLALAAMLQFRPQRRRA